MTEKTVFDPVAHGWRPGMPASSGFETRIGPLWKKPGDDGRWRYGFLAMTHHINLQGVVHGGMLLSFADEALGQTVWRAVQKRPCATVSLNGNFVGPARLGDWVEAETEIVRHGRAMIFTQARIYVGERTVFNADGIWKLLGVD